MTPEDAAIIREKFDREPTIWTSEDEREYQEARKHLWNGPCECLACVRGVPKVKGDAEPPAPAWEAQGPHRQPIERKNAPGESPAAFVKAAPRKARRVVLASVAPQAAAVPPSAASAPAAPKAACLEEIRLTAKLRESGVIA